MLYGAILMVLALYKAAELLEDFGRFQWFQACEYSYTGSSTIFHALSSPYLPKNRVFDADPAQRCQPVHVH